MEFSKTKAGTSISAPAAPKEAMCPVLNLGALFLPFSPTSLEMTWPLRGKWVEAGLWWLWGDLQQMQTGELRFGPNSSLKLGGVLQEGWVARVLQMET